MWVFEHRHFDDQTKEETAFWVWPERMLSDSFARHFDWERTHRLGRASARISSFSEHDERGEEDREYHSVFLEGRKR
jgi:hypothetical protein